MSNDLISRVFTTTREYKKKDTGETVPFVQKYHYTTRSPILEGGNPVFDFLKSLILEGRPDIGERKSVSSGPKLAVPVKQGKHALLEHAGLAEWQGCGPDQHLVLQRYLLAQDPLTLAVEVPVWDDEWLGHIDILQWNEETKKLSLFDFKPKAAAETKAASQVFRYRELLSRHVGIPALEIGAGYFDEFNFYYI